MEMGSFRFRFGCLIRVVYTTKPPRMQPDFVAPAGPRGRQWVGLSLPRTVTAADDDALG